jgi:hypothetical protein
MDWWLVYRSPEQMAASSPRCRPMVASSEVFSSRPAMAFLEAVRRD